MDPHRPRHEHRGRPGRAELGGRVRQGLPDRALRQRHRLDDDPLHHHRHRRRRDPHRLGDRTLHPAAGHPARATPWGYSLHEFQVYSTTGGNNPGGDVLLSYGKAGSASTSQHNGTCWECGPDKAFDRDPASRWATSPEGGWTDPGWIAVDLGAPAQINRVVLQWDPAYARAYRIEVSDNGADWRTIHQTASGTGFKETLDVSGTGRHVRLYATERSGQYGYWLRSSRSGAPAGRGGGLPRRCPLPHVRTGSSRRLRPRRCRPRARPRVPAGTGPRTDMAGDCTCSALDPLRTGRLARPGGSPGGDTVTLSVR
ncbi:hypothetical protein SMICM304S_06023 [Streptomyces microflavus]